MNPRALSSILLAAALLWPHAALAHPLGNFSINHYAALRIEGGDIRLRYRLDVAELPTVEEMRVLDADADGRISDAERNTYLAKRSAEWAAGLRLSVNGNPSRLEMVGGGVETRPGAADLPTLLITLDFRAPLDAPIPGRAGSVVEYADENYRGRAGWKEVIATAETGWVLAESNVPATDASHGLESYPSDLTVMPPQTLAARLVVVRGTGASRTGEPSRHSAVGDRPPPPLPSTPRTPQDRFTQLITAKTPSPFFVIFSLSVAFGLGSIHALAPGHGKTVVAAYLVGSRGTLKHALLLGAVVTLTHVAGVFLLGFIVLFLSRYVIPEQLYPWLGFASGMTILLVGAQQFVQRRSAYSRVAGEGPDDGHSHDLARGGHTHNPPDRLSIGGLIAMGVSGGMVPCPSALLVLLGAIAVGRVGFGLVLIVAFSLGLASVLVAIGVLVLYAKRWLEQFQFAGGGSWSRRLPLVSAAAVAILGLVIAIQSLAGAGGLGAPRSVSGGRDAATGSK